MLSKKNEALMWIECQRSIVGNVKGLIGTHKQYRKERIKLTKMCNKFIKKYSLCELNQELK